MSEQPAPEPAEQAVTTAPGPQAGGPPWPYPPDMAPLIAPRKPVPRVVVKADLLPAVSLLSLLALLGIPLGWAWSRLAPGQQVQVFPDGKPYPLRVESYHRFDDLAVFLLLGLGVGLLIGVIIWLFRERRGPVVLLAAVIGGILAAWLAGRMGLSFADGLFPQPSAPKVGDIFTQPPRLESGWRIGMFPFGGVMLPVGIVMLPLGIVVAYGAAAAWNGLDDLGRRLR